MTLWHWLCLVALPFIYPHPHPMLLTLFSCCYCLPLPFHALPAHWHCRSSPLCLACLPLFGRWAWSGLPASNWPCARALPACLLAACTPTPSLFALHLMGRHWTGQDRQWTGTGGQGQEQPRRLRRCCGSEVGSSFSELIIYDIRTAVTFYIYYYWELSKQQISIM